MVAGRIEIDDVAPVVSGGGIRPRPSSARWSRSRATVWREGHDAVSATLVVRYHGTAYPRLARPPGRVRTAQPVPIEDVVDPAPRRQPQLLPMSIGPRARRIPRRTSPRQRRACGRSGWTAGATRSPRGARASRPSSTPARAKAELSNDLLIGARLLERAATGRPAPGPLSPDRGSGQAARARRPVRPGRRRAVARGGRAARRSIRCANWSPAASNTGSGWTGRWPGSVPGTRCSRGPPAAGTPRATPCTARSPPPPRRCRASPRWASTWSTCRRSTRSARCTARAATTRATAAPKDVGSPWAIGSDKGGHDAVHPKLGTIEDFDDFVVAARDHGLEVALDLALQCAPDHPWAQRPPGVVHRAARRHDRLRGEPAEEVPGHLPGELRQRSRGALRGGAAGGAVLDLPRRQGLSGRQPAHQTAELLGLADRRGRRTTTPTCCSCPRRSPGRPGCTGWPSSASRSPTRISPGAPRSGS